MELLSGFAWPVPRAFASAVSMCRFEQGDVLYDAACAYAEGEREPTSGPGHHVQIFDPPRSARAAPADAAGNRFAANWESPISFEFCDYGAGTTEVRTASQGRLFTCLWKGDREVLLGGGETASPPLPAVARDLQRQLAQAVPALQDALAKDVEVGLLYVAVLDQASESSLGKARLVESNLSSQHQCHTALLSPSAAGVPAAESFHPTLQLCGTAVATDDESAVRALLKAALYAPTRAQSADEASSSDRFKLERHGLLVPIEVRRSSRLK